ncbi:MAG: AsnC family transcriptional regulator [bacterium]|nr:AsnC family transcriptional regulator [bacterium]
MDEIDKRILIETQINFPLCKRPFKVLADRFGITEEEVLCKIRRLKRKGFIRRISPSFDSRRLGFVSTLIAMKVPKEKIEDVANIVNRYDGVTHNYERQYEYNLWFTLISESNERLEEIINGIKEKTGIDQILNLPSLRVFKIDVNLIL